MLVLVKISSLSIMWTIIYSIENFFGISLEHVIIFWQFLYRNESNTTELLHRSNFFEIIFERLDQIISRGSIWCNELLFALIRFLNQFGLILAYFCQQVPKFLKYTRLRLSRAGVLVEFYFNSAWENKILCLVIFPFLVHLPVVLCHYSVQS